MATNGSNTGKKKLQLLRHKRANMEFDYFKTKIPWDGQVTPVVALNELGWNLATNMFNLVVAAGPKQNLITQW